MQAAAKCKKTFCRGLFCAIIVLLANLTEDGLYIDAAVDTEERGQENEQFKGMGRSL